MEPEPEMILSPSGEVIWSSLTPPKKDDVVLCEDRGLVYVYSISKIREKIKREYSAVWGSKIAYIFVLEDTICAANPAAIELLGDVEGKSFEELFGVELREGKLRSGRFSLYARRIGKKLRMYEIAAIENPFELVLDAVGEVVLLLEGDRIAYANNAVKKYGYSPDDLIGAVVSKFLTRTSGAAMLRDVSGRLIPVVVDRVDATVVIRDRSGDAYRNLMEVTPDFVGVLDLSGRIVYTNRALKSVGDVEGRRIFDLIVEGDRKKCEEFFKRSMETGEVVKEIIRMEIGGRLYVLDMACAFVYAEGEPLYAIFVARDLTDRVRLERFLAEREEVYRTLAENSHTLLLIARNGRIVYANRRALEVLGYEDPDSMPELAELLQMRLDVEEGEVREFEVHVPAKSGRRKWMKAIASRINFEGEPAVLINLADITDLKEKEEKLRNLNEVLEVVTDLSRIMSKERSEVGLISKLATVLERLGRVAVFFGTDETPVFISEEIDRRRVFEVYRATKNRSRVISEGNVIGLPIVGNGVFGCIVIECKRELSDEEVRLLEALSRDLAVAFKAIRTDNLRESALKLIVENLHQFEVLADKLWNPLAILRGYLEVRDSVNLEELLRKVDAQVRRMERILSDLRAREVFTYEMKKILESFGSETKTS